ncbi:IDEAL domain-containing protein [Marinicrinis sediminis]|uniref:IDEAL domain-containing protein n=1 Tax=Marinicrinis sediminis TaxID=1652465 RepID=A0ABW5RE94_9BACL
MSIIYDALLSLHAEMFLDHSIREYRLRQIYEGIDRALENGDQETFYSLTSEMMTIRQQEKSPIVNDRHKPA